jgi:hypothetical protein
VLPSLRHSIYHLDFLQTHCFLQTTLLFPANPQQFEIKAFLESVHGMQVESVSTINYQGKKQRTVDSGGRVHYRCVQGIQHIFVLYCIVSIAACASMHCTAQELFQLCMDAAAACCGHLQLPAVHRRQRGSRALQVCAGISVEQHVPIVC